MKTKTYSDRSYVSLEQQQCIVCLAAFDTGNILMDKRMKASLEHHTTTGHGICPECKAKLDAGYLALVEANNPTGKATASLEEAQRTGTCAWIKRTAMSELCDVALAADEPLAFVEPGVIDYLMSLVQGDAEPA